MLTAFSTSGNSENVRRALVAANHRGIHTVAFLGRGGGQCTGLAHIEFLVASQITARVQEAHKFLLHTLCELVELQLEAHS